MKYASNRVIHGMVPNEIADKLEILAQHGHCSVAAIMRRAFYEYIERNKEVLKQEIESRENTY